MIKNKSEQIDAFFAELTQLCDKYKVEHCINNRDYIKIIDIVSITFILDGSKIISKPERGSHISCAMIDRKVKT